MFCGAGALISVWRGSGATHHGCVRHCGARERKPVSGARRKPVSGARERKPVSGARRKPVSGARRKLVSGATREPQ
jgi:hypothetical protein